MPSEGLKEDIAKEHEKGNCIVAFIDILGFKEHVEKYVNGENKEILENIKSALDSSLKNVKKGENRKLKLIKYKFFSDCTCLSIPDYYNTETEATMLCLLITVIKGYIFRLIKSNIYLRGGLSVGFHYEDGNMIFSDGLIKAYNLEKKAIHPRIILDKELVQRLERLWINQKDEILYLGAHKVIIVDEKGTAFINPFNLMQSMNKGFLEDERKKFSSERAYKNHLLKTDNKFNEEILGKVRKKIRKCKKTLEKLKKSFENKKTCEEYLLKADCYCNMEVLGNDKEKVKEYIEKKRVLDKYLWLRQLIKWNIKPESSKIKFEYLLK